MTSHRRRGFPGTSGSIATVLVGVTMAGTPSIASAQGPVAPTGLIIRGPRDNPEVAERARRAEALLRGNKPGDAATAYQQLISEHPKFFPALSDLAWIRATARDPALRDPKEAVRLAEAAFQEMIVDFNDRPRRSSIPPNYDKLLILRVGSALGAAYAAAGRFESSPDPSLQKRIAAGAVAPGQGGDMAASGELAAVPVATWAVEMGDALAARMATREAATIQKELRDLLTLYQQKKPLTDGRLPIGQLPR